MDSHFVGLAVRVGDLTLQRRGIGIALLGPLIEVFCALSEFGLVVFRLRELQLVPVGTCGRSQVGCTLFDLGSLNAEVVSHHVNLGEFRFELLVVATSLQFPLRAFGLGHFVLDLIELGRKRCRRCGVESVRFLERLCGLRDQSLDLFSLGHQIG